MNKKDKNVLYVFVIAFIICSSWIVFFFSVLSIPSIPITTESYEFKDDWLREQLIAENITIKTIDTYFDIIIPLNYSTFMAKAKQSGVVYYNEGFVYMSRFVILADLNCNCSSAYTFDANSIEAQK